MKNKKNQNNVVCVNKKASYTYFTEKNFEAGLVLQSWEVKAIRQGKIDITNSYVSIKDKEAYIVGANIQPIQNLHSSEKKISTRIRKLLLQRTQLNEISKFLHEKSYTVVVMCIFWKKSWCKTKIALAKGKKKFDKRQEKKQNEWEIKKQEIIR